MLRMYFSQNMVLILYGLFLLYEYTLSLKLLELEVASHVPLGTRAALSCRWQLGPTDVLYSVKWYKDGNEFFRHVPRDVVQPRRKFPLPGVDVEEFDLSGSEIVIAPAALATAGRYRCEVSGEGPLFPTVSDHADMVIVALPKHGPVLSGLSSKYRTGDRLIVNCTSGPSLPATTLAWYLNGEPLPLGIPSHWTEEGFVTTTLVLEFKVAERHFQKNVLRIKCLATINPIYWRSNEKSAVLNRNRIFEKDGRDTVTPALQVKSNSGYSHTSMTLIHLGILINLVVRNAIF